MYGYMSTFISNLCFVPPPCSYSSYGTLRPAPCLQAMDERKAQLVAKAREICQQRIKLIEQQQMDLAVKSTLVEEALSKGERVCAANALRSPAAGENIVCVCVCLYFVYLCMHVCGTWWMRGFALFLSRLQIILYVYLSTCSFLSYL